MSDLQVTASEQATNHYHYHQDFGWGFFCGFASGLLFALIIVVAILMKATS